MFAGKKSAQIREILISESAWEEMTCLFAPSLDTLSNQEMRVLRYILNGMDYSSIASKMNISNKTVSTYKSRLMEKLDCSSLMEIYDYAQRNKIG